jgi:hypothetical protein
VWLFFADHLGFAPFEGRVRVSEKKSFLPLALSKMVEKMGVGVRQVNQNEFFMPRGQGILQLGQQRSSTVIHLKHPFKVENYVRGRIEIGVKSAQKSLHGREDKVSLELVDTNGRAPAIENFLFGATAQAFRTDPITAVGAAHRNGRRRSNTEHVQFKALRNFFTN